LLKLRQLKIVNLILQRELDNVATEITLGLDREIFDTKIEKVKKELEALKNNAKVIPITSDNKSFLKNIEEIQNQLLALSQKEFELNVVSTQAREEIQKLQKELDDLTKKDLIDPKELKNALKEMQTRFKTIKGLILKLDLKIFNAQLKIIKSKLNKLDDHEIKISNPDKINVSVSIGHFREEVAKLKGILATLDQFVLNTKPASNELTRIQAQVNRLKKTQFSFKVKEKVKVGINKTYFNQELAEIKRKIRELATQSVTIKPITFTGFVGNLVEELNKVINKFADDFKSALNNAKTQVDNLSLEIIGDAEGASIGEQSPLALSFTTFVEAINNLSNTNEKGLKSIKKILQEISSICKSQQKHLVKIRANTTRTARKITSTRVKRAIQSNQEGGNGGVPRRSNSSNTTNEFLAAIRKGNAAADRVSANTATGQRQSLATLELNIQRMETALERLNQTELPNEIFEEYEQDLNRLRNIFIEASRTQTIQDVEKVERDVDASLLQIDSDSQRGRTPSASVVEANLQRVERALESLGRVEIDDELQDYRERLEGRRGRLREINTNTRRRTTDGGFSLQSFLGESAIDAVEAFNNELGNTLRIAARLYTNLQQGEGVIANLSTFAVPLGFLTLGATLAGITVFGAEAVISIQKLEQTLNSLNLSDVEKTVNDAKRIALESGVDISQVASQSGKFAAATRGTTLEKESGRIFESVVDFGVSIGASPDEISRGLVALEQIAAKGRVSLEELNGQLSEALPGASNIAAESIGVTRKELFAMAERGDLLAKDLLPALATAFQNIQKNSAGTEVKILNREFSRLVQQVKLTSAEVSKTPLQLVTNSLALINDLLQKNKTATSDLAIIIQSITGAMALALLTTVNFGGALTALGVAIKAFGVTLAAASTPILAFIGVATALGLALKAVQSPPELKVRIKGLETSISKVKALRKQLVGLDKDSKGKDKDENRPNLATRILRKGGDNARRTVRTLSNIGAGARDASLLKDVADLVLNEQRQEEIGISDKTSLLDLFKQSNKEAKEFAESQTFDNKETTTLNALETELLAVLEAQEKFLANKERIAELNAQISETRRASGLISGASAILEDPNVEDPLNTPLVQQLLVEFDIAPTTAKDVSDKLNTILVNLRQKTNDLTLEVIPGGEEGINSTVKEFESFVEALARIRTDSPEDEENYQEAVIALERAREVQKEYNDGIEKSVVLNSQLGRSLSALESNREINNSEVELNTQLRTFEVLRQAQQNGFADSERIDEQLTEVKRQELVDRLEDNRQYYRDLKKLEEEFTDEELELIKLSIPGFSGIENLSIPQLNNLKQNEAFSSSSIKVFDTLIDARNDLSENVRLQNEIFELDRRKLEQTVNLTNQRDSIAKQVETSRSNLLKSFRSSLESLESAFVSLQAEAVRIDAEINRKETNLSVLKNTTAKTDDIGSAINDLINQVAENIEATKLDNLDLEQEEISIQNEFEIGVRNLKEAFDDYLIQFRHFQEELRNLQNQANAANQASSSVASGSSTPGAAATTGGTQANTVTALRRAIIGQESNGNFRAVNRDAEADGKTAAYGYGQVLGQNIPRWTKQALGEALTPQQFLNSPEKQIKTIDYQLNSFFQRHLKESNGDKSIALRKTIAEWYSGQPDKHNNRAREFSNGREYPSIAAYTDKVVERFNTEVAKITPKATEVLNTVSTTQTQLVSNTTSTSSSSSTQTPPPPAPKPTLKDRLGKGNANKIIKIASPPVRRDSLNKAKKLPAAPPLPGQATNASQINLAPISFNTDKEKEALKKALAQQKENKEQREINLEKTQTNKKLDKEIREENLRIQSSGIGELFAEEIKERIESLEEFRATASPNERELALNTASKDFDGLAASIRQFIQNLETRQINNEASRKIIEEKKSDPNLSEAQKENLAGIEAQIKQDDLTIPGQIVESKNILEDTLARVDQSRKTAAALFDAEVSFIREFGGRLETIDGLLNEEFLTSKQRKDLTLEQFTLTKKESYESELQELADFYQRAGITREEALVKAKEQLDSLNALEFDQLKKELNGIRNLGIEVVGGLASDLAKFDLVSLFTGEENIGEQLKGIFSNLLGTVQSFAAKAFENNVLGKFFGNKDAQAEPTTSSSSVLGSLATTTSTGLGIADIVGSVFGSLFAKGGEVGQPSLSIKDAMSQERSISGKQPVLSVLHAGEQVLSTLNGDAQFFRTLQQQGSWDALKNSYAFGGSVGGDSRILNQGNSFNSNSNSNSMVYHTTNISIQPQSPDLIRATASQIQRRRDRLI